MRSVSCDEMLELASYGAKMAPRSIEMGMVYNVPIVVSSSFHENQGTLIHREVNMRTESPKCETESVALLQILMSPKLRF